jgi:hypothetical protein
MSTKMSLKYRERTEAGPGFHLYKELFDPGVYLQLDGVQVELVTIDGGASVTVAIPPEMARELGMLPATEPATE